MYTTKRKIILVLITLGLLLSAQGLEKSREYLQKGSYDMALKTLTKVVKESKGLKGKPELIELYKITGKYSKAIELATGLSLSPKKKDKLLGHHLLGELLMLTGEYEKAEKNFLFVNRNDSYNLVNYVALGECYLAIGKTKDAVEIFSDIFDNYDPYEEYSAAELTSIGQACRLYAMNSDDVDRSDTLKTIVQDILPEATGKDPYYFRAHEIMAEMFLDAYNHNDAKFVIEDALKLNRQHPGLLYLKAGYMMQNFAMRPKVIPALKHVLQINPNFVPAFNLRAVIYLTDQEYDKAEKMLEDALKVNPYDLEALSLLAASYRMQNKLDKYQEYVKKTLKVNPRYGLLYQTIAMMVESKRLFADAVELGKKAVKLDPFLWSGYVNLGHNLMRLGKIDEARMYFEKVQDEYNFHIQTHNTLMLLDKYKEFETFRTPNFIIRIHKSEAELMYPLLSELLEESFAVLKEQFEFTPKTPILYEMFPSHQDFSVRTIGLDSLGASGVCFGEVVVGTSPTARIGGRYFNWASVTWHEFAHVLTLQMTNYQVPRWFTEGLSEFAERERNPSNSRPLELELYSIYKSGRMRGIRNLNAGFTRPTYAQEIVICYFQSGYVCEFIAREFGFDKILKMLSLYKQEKSDEEVFKEALGVSIENFDQRFSQWLEDNIFNEINVFTGADSKQIDDLLDELEEDPINEEILLKLSLAYFQSGKYTDAKIYAGQLLSIYPNQVVPYEIMGYIDYYGGKTEQGRKMFEKAAKLGSRNFYTYHSLGMIYLRERKIAQATSYLKKAKELFPAYVKQNNPYLVLASIYEKNKNKPGMLHEWEELVKRDGENFVIRMKLGKEYFLLKRYREAIRVLLEARDIFPASFELQDTLAKSFEAVGKTLEAAKSYSLAAATQKKAEARPEIYFKAAQLYQKVGKKDEAIKCLDRALKIRPNYVDAKKLKEQLQ